MLLGWARPATDARSRVPFWVVLLVSLPIVFGLGTWGFLELNVSPRLDLVDSLYRSLKLYYLDLGPVASAGQPKHAGWQIWIAFLAATLVLARGALALFRRQLRRLVMRHWLRGHVVVCGATVHGTRLVRELSASRDIVLVDPDSESLGMRASSGRYEWRLTSDSRRRETLIDAGLRRAEWIVALTDDDLINSQIVSAVRELAAAGQLDPELRVLVQAEDPVVARFLEETETLAEGMTWRGVTSFSMNAIAAEALISASNDRFDADATAPDDLLDVPDGTAPHLLLAGDHPIVDALTLGVLRHWRVRVLQDAEVGAPVRRPPVHVSLFGPGSLGRAERLRQLWRPEPHVMTLEARDSERTGERGDSVEEWLRAPDRADHAIVACCSELDSVRLTLRLSRTLGDGRLLTRVNTQLDSDIDRHIEDRTSHDARLATTRVISIADLASDPAEMSRLTPRHRLQAALEPSMQRAGRRGDAGRLIPVDATELAGELFDRASELGLRTDLAWRIAPSERPVLEAVVDPVPLSAIVRAGLRVDFGSATNLRTAARRISASQTPSPGDGCEADAQIPSHAAVVAWCEFARHVTRRSAEYAEGWLSEPTGHPATDRIVLLRRAAVDDELAHETLSQMSAAVAGGDQLRARMKRTTSLTIFAGPAGSMTTVRATALEQLLMPALRGHRGMVISGGTAEGVPGVVGRVANEHDLGLVGYVPPGRGDHSLYREVRETPAALYGSSSEAHRPFSIREPLMMWTDIVAAGASLDHVAVIVFRGGQIADEELLLARTLGARVAWIDDDGAAASPLADTLPAGDAGVIQLPADPMTIRAFLSRPGLDAHQSEQIGQYLHNEYRRKQHRRKPFGDPALAPWDDLLEPLKASNRAQAADIPNKLALLGRRIEPDGPPLSLSRQEVEVLAEAEHGRWNVERILTGWGLGDRQIDQSFTPHLRPWTDLSDENKEYDREAVRSIAPALAETGLGVVPVGE